MTQPGPGWYTDPQDEQQVRWWDGDAWSDQRQGRVQQPVPVGAPTPAPAYVPMAGYGATRVVEAPPTKKDKDRQVRKNNSLAYTGCVLAILSFLFNPFAILSVLGIVFGAIGLAKSHELEGAGHKITGRGTAIAAIVLGLIGIAFAGYRMSQLG
ncbi:DUF2510 domain-containing protein [Cryobacterium tagatosivorans]|uniref:DUF2510 domain-containing protein n=1 Tax=Cryobacterium tagatosivorans TaxID=1259199 RepID=A0A4R8UAC9_9MICO|nr:DUF2510 domain-containing protein [Cryobacterium tagatosivorans]TFB46982.1 DUF2510 domain-containing protein [Cryobacterium tagatosivorans]